MLTRADADRLLPIMDALRNVGSDLHRLDIAGEFDDVLGHVPLMGRIERRIESEADADDPDRIAPGSPASRQVDT